MLETYDVEVLTTNITNTFQIILQVMFNFSVVITTIWIILSLVIWLFGARKKSEKAIKFGIKNFIVSIIIGILTLLIPIFMNIM